jgi:putative DNA primase/helicase
LVTATETEDGRRWAEARIKELTGGDRITARFMRQDFFDFTPQFKLLFSGNHMPALRTVNMAISRRFRRIPFTVTIPEDQVNVRLAEELMEEAPGILQWLVDGCLAWQSEGLKPPAAVTTATESYFDSQDVLGDWLDECCDVGANYTAIGADLFAEWKSWAEARNEFVGSRKAFTQKLEDRGFVSRKGGKGVRLFSGLRLKPQKCWDPVRKAFVWQQEPPPGEPGVVKEWSPASGIWIWVEKRETAAPEAGSEDGR